MKTVTVTELKAHLSKYLREVRRGGEIQVLERGVPIARLTQLPASISGDNEAERQRLIQSGVLRPGSGDVASFLKEPPVRLRSGLRGALDREREDRV